jgi:hypothetical protein
MWEHGPQDKVAPGRFHDPACGTGGMLLATDADLPRLRSLIFSLSIPLSVARTPAAASAAGEDGEPESRAEAWAKWKADGKTFWRQMDEVTAMLFRDHGFLNFLICKVRP